MSRQVDSTLGNESAALLIALRRALRSQGWTGKKIADQFGVSEATVRRWLGGRALTLARLHELADLAGLTLADLAGSTAHPPADLAQELTLAQENALAGDSLLSFLFLTLVGGEAWQDVAREFEIPEDTVESLLARLAKLALIDRLPGGRVRTLVDRNVLWRKSPLRERFESQMKPQFMAMNFAAPEAVYASEVVKLSEVGAAKLAEAIERHRRELHRLVEADRRSSLLPRRWRAVLFAVRPLDGARLKEEMQ